MLLDLDSGKLVVFVAGLVLFFALETLRPARPLPQSRWQRFAFHGALAAVNTVVMRVLVFVPFLLWAVYVEEQGWGLSRWLGLAGWVEIAASIVVLDGLDYFWHRANHRIALLWRFHKAHHADTAVDLSTALRFHPGELVISGLVKAGWILLWGPTAVAWFLFEALVSFCAQFHHANLALPSGIERRLRHILVTPEYHATHHAVDRRWGDRNFATIFPFWDRLFGSAVDPASGPAPLDHPDAIGLPQGRERAFSALAWLLEPFQARNVSLARANRAPDPASRATT